MASNNELHEAIKRLQRVAELDGRIHKLSAFQILLLAAISELKESMSLEEALGFVEASWNELDKINKDKK